MALTDTSEAARQRQLDFYAAKSGADKVLLASEMAEQAKQIAMMADVTTYVASAEDTILSKLEWSEDSGSERQFRDVVAVIQIQRASLDLDSLDRWATELGIDDRLRAALDAAN